MTKPLEQAMQDASVSNQIDVLRHRIEYLKADAYNKEVSAHTARLLAAKLTKDLLKLAEQLPSTPRMA